MMARKKYDKAMEKCTILWTTNTMSIMKVSGSIILNMDKENMCLKMGIFMRVVLKRIYIMDMEK